MICLLVLLETVMGELMKLLYVPYVPSHAERLILANRNILEDQMEFLQQMLPAHSRLL